MQSDRSRIKQINVISLDVWGTILRVNPIFARLRRELFFTYLGKGSINRTDFFAAFEEMKITTERLSEQEGRHVGFTERLKHLTDKLQLTPFYAYTQLEEEQNKMCLNHPPTLLSEEIPRLLSDIKDCDIGLVVVSNTGLIRSEIVEQILETYHIKKYIDRFIFSDHTKLAKPNPKIFYEALGNPTTHALHVGDSLRADFEGAQRAGFSALHMELSSSNIRVLRQILKLDV